jgi:hypothetical protein
MKLPRFWRGDSGMWNDTLISAAIIVGLAVPIGLALFWPDQPWLLQAAVVLGPLTGLFLGLALVAVLCTYFTAPRDEPPSPGDNGASRHEL